MAPWPARWQRPPGQLLARIATVNDLHFGELEAGRLDEHSTGPVQRVPDGAEPYPEVMNRTAAAEMLAHRSRCGHRQG